jgi:hypothetical protein
MTGSRGSSSRNVWGDVSCPCRGSTTRSGEDGRAEDGRAEDAIRTLVDCDARLARYREALEAGTDPTVVARWIAEVQAERRSAEEELRRRRPAAAFTEDDIRAMVKSLGDLVGNLRAADAQRKTDLYDSLGLSLAYKPSKRRVQVEVHLEGVRPVRVGGGI